MKKETSFIALMSICGLVTGLAITAILMAIASPDHLTNQILTIAEKQDLVTMIGVAERITGNTIDRIKVKNLPGPIALNIENSVADVGDIEINVE